jgi:hypothetical protein
LPDKLIIFDYSGTLSPKMAAFARPNNLMKHLKSSGLFALGVDSTALFWEIINVTWTEGSTTKLGYKKVMRECICKLFPAIAELRQPEVKRAVSNFVDAYLDYSCIDEHWRFILQDLSSDKSVQVIIATDHYAEATNVIINRLSVWNIQATTMEAGIKDNFIVANSADIGVHKTEKKFWETIQANCGIDLKRVLLIDDFGANEQSSDAYAQTKEISRRRQKTIKLLENAFSARVESFSFAATEAPIGDVISQVSAKIRQFLSEGKSGNIV